MIIHHRDWLGDNISHECKTVREFINKELMKISNKEKKYFRICTKAQYEGKQNLLLYFQDGKLKSHHSTKIAFDYNDVLDYEIYGTYSIDDLEVTNIDSIDSDCEEEMAEKLNKIANRNKDLIIDRETLGMSKQEKIMYSIDKMFEEDVIRRSIKDNKDITDDTIVKALKILFKQTDEITTLNNKIAELEKKVEQQSQQIKWLGKNK